MHNKYSVEWHYLVAAFVLGCYTWFVLAVNAQTKGTVTPNFIPPFPVKLAGKSVNAGIVLDANWRWSRKIESMQNCFSGSWDPSVCTDPVQCSKNCALEGVSEEQYKNSYGITTQNGAVTLRYVTYGPYGRNVGSRVYVLDESKQNYLAFNPVGYEISFVADVSKLPCGLNGAVYLVEMPLDGGKNSLNSAGAPFGTGYGDAQCPTDIKYIRGWTNLNKTGACANEHDLFETNSQSYAFTLHPCSKSQVYPCTDAKSCGQQGFRYQGVCDKDGADYNPFRFGNKTVYGPGSQFQVDTTQPFEVITQFITDNWKPTGKLVEVRRVFKQKGKTVFGGSLTQKSVETTKIKFGESNDFARLGGMAAVEASLRRKHVFVMSLWDDNSSAQMRWLDSVYPVGSGKSSDMRGRCSPNDNRDVEGLRNQYASASVTYSQLQLRSLTPPKEFQDDPTGTVSPSKKWMCQSCQLV